METAKISQLYDLGETIAAELFAGLTYPWEALPKISDFIKKLGPTLDPEVYEQRGENIWVAKSATVAPTAFLNGPLIIDEDAEIRHCLLPESELVHVLRPLRLGTCFQLP
jgi:UDP-N-acetylglucosamine diphosphorylase / glucose-1-phosphate thymidylyltransferase / UDP-N-acetylgalactosamine diphosphorylase / glucosamine-1-phosphate N-acetyltransferase / galactosamine-1-phosphate N-acetyltransferase